jgi:hypothetical protein
MRENELDVNKEYFTFNIGVNNKNTGLINYTGIIKVRQISKSSPGWRNWGKYVVIESKPLSATIERELNWLLSSSLFYETLEDAEIGHDKKIQQCARSMRKDCRLKTLKKLIHKKVSEIELASRKYYNELSTKDKKLVDWLINNL